MTLTPSNLRQGNRRVLVDLLMRVGSASRAELAKAAGMSQVTAGKIADDLLGLGVLEEMEVPVNGGKASPRLGRPGRLLRLDGQHPRFVLIHLGVRQTYVATAPAGGHGQDQWMVKFPTPRSASQWLDRLKEIAQALPGRDLWAALVSVPGVVDEDAGRVLFSPNLHWSERADLPEMIRSVWKAPVRMVQEIRALALGRLALNPADRDFLLVDFGDGVGGAAVIGGRLYEGPLPLSGELGHMPVLGNDRPCGCGAVGCLETLAGQRGLLESFAASSGSHAPAWTTLVKHVTDHGIEPWLAKSLDATAAAIAGAMNVLGLRNTVITGSMWEMPPSVMQHLAGAIRRGAMWGRFGEVACVAEPRRRIAGLVAVGLEQKLGSIAGVSTSE